MTENGHDSIWVSPGSTTTYYVVISSNICNAEDTLSVTVNMQSNPDVKIVQAGPKICNAPFAQLLATGASSYSWSPANTLSSEEGASPQSFAQTDTWYTVTGFNEFGCSGKDSALMRVETDNFNGLFVPSVFTPNADGKNDCYRIILPPGLSEYELHIYNRWGENVFTADDPTDCWDGTYKGEPCDLGTYFYYYKLKSDRCEIEKEGKGDITLLR